MSPKELRSRRIGLGLTVQDMAFELGLTPREVQQMEEGEIPLPPHALLSALFARMERRFRSQRSRSCPLAESGGAQRARL